MMTRDQVLAALARHVGPENGQRADLLVAEITGAAPSAADQRRLRRLIAELRAEGHHICAHPETGYFIARDEADLDHTCRFLYERAMCSLSQVAAMKRVSLPDLAGQLRLKL